ncbi:MAG: hypothetical protein IPI57_09025 [Candidatus Competibacteraceae bacterium]|nr:hypothetical protein [Candidatus Competibacteraceae bacterium]
MKNDSIVDEVRNNGLALIAQCNNDIEAIFKALKARERISERRVVNREPRRLPTNSHAKKIEPQSVSTD